MNILIVGGGGREHALTWKLKQSPKIKEIFVAPGNAGTSTIAKNIDISNQEDILNWIKKNPIDLVIVGPDNYLESGLVDELQNLKVPVFGPTKKASEIEWSKAFSKQFMKEEGIPTAAYEIFTDIEKAKEHVQNLYINNQKPLLVIKASGLALGKGVVITHSLEEAECTLDEIMGDKVFGKAGDEVVIEEYLEGREISIHAFCDGEHAVLFPAAQDHKRIFDNDMGPNTGGMGTIAPVPWTTPELMEEINQKVVIPTLSGLKKRDREFKGILFPGIMITKDGPKVIEFNARFGDPETQSYMRILETDLLDILLSCVHGTVQEQEIKWSTKCACCIICASGGYPAAYEKGKIIKGLENVENIVEEKALYGRVLFHSGTRYIDSAADGDIVTNGGRVLGVTSIADTLGESLSKAYSAVDLISFDGMQYRSDIGKKSL